MLKATAAVLRLRLPSSAMRFVPSQRSSSEPRTMLVVPLRRRMISKSELVPLLVSGTSK